MLAGSGIILTIFFSVNSNLFAIKQLQEICGNRIKAGFFNVIIQDIAVHGTND